MPKFKAGFQNLKGSTKFFVFAVARGSGAYGGIATDAYFCPNNNKTILGTRAAKLFKLPPQNMKGVTNDLVVSVRDIRGQYDQVDITIPKADVQISDGVPKDWIQIGGRLITDYFDLTELRLKIRNTKCYNRLKKALTTSP